MPISRSLEPHSSVLMCADSAQMTASCLRSNTLRPRMLAPLPFSTRKASSAPKISRRPAVARPVHISAP